jgi:hypothetical protein
MKKSACLLSIVLLNGCVGVTPEPTEVTSIVIPQASPQVEDNATIMLRGGALHMSIDTPWIFTAKDVVIDIPKDPQGDVTVTFTDAASGNRCTAIGNYSITGCSSKNFQVRDHRKTP